MHAQPFIHQFTIKLQVSAGGTSRVVQCVSNYVAERKY